MSTAIRRRPVRNGVLGAALAAGLVAAGPADAGAALPAALPSTPAPVLAAQPVSRRRT